MKTTQQKWGNSLVIRVPKRVAEEAGLSEKAAVEVEVRKGTLAGCAAASAAREGLIYSPRAMWHG